MIIIGTYAETVPALGEAALPLTSLGALLGDLAPPTVGLHILPFYPNSGDGGFAIDDWFTVRADLGSWRDIVHLAAYRPVILDGVYNHVGVGHPWVKELLSSDQGRHLFYVYDSDVEGTPMSPRGQPALVQHSVGGRPALLWQTFTGAAADINLDNSIVRAEIEAHLAFLQGVGVWGVRLDAVAYYGKDLHGPIRHSPDSIRLANELCRAVRARGLQPFAQLDCDDNAQNYFRDPVAENTPVNDFSFTAYLALATLEQDASPLALYLSRTANISASRVFAPRTHDGILLRVPLMTQGDRERLIQAMILHEYELRMSEGTPYEFNCSGPRLYSTVCGPERVHEAIELVTAVSGLAGQWAYYYLPFLLGYMPETYGLAPPSFDDPRSLNRVPVPQDFLAAPSTRAHLARTYGLLEALERVHERIGTFDGRRPAAASCPAEPFGLELVTWNGQYRLIANFHAGRPLGISLSKDEHIVWHRHLAGTELGPLGYVILERLQSL